MVVLNAVGEPLLCPKCKKNVMLRSYDDRLMYVACDGKCHSTRAGHSTQTVMRRWRKWEDAYNETDSTVHDRLVERLDNATKAFGEPS